MAKELGALIVQLQGDVNRLKSDMGKARSVTRQATGAMGKAADQLKAKFAGIAAGLSVAAFAGAIKNTLNFGDELQKLAIRTGFTTEELSRLQYAAEIGGSSLETIVTASRRVSRAALDAQAGLKTYTRAFDTLGINVDKFLKLTPSQQITALGEALQRIESPTVRTAAAVQLAGRRGAELISIFVDGEQSVTALGDKLEALGGVISRETADKFAELNDRMTTLKFQARAASVQLLEYLVPAFEELVPIVKAISGPIGFFVSGLKNLGKISGAIAAAVVNDGLSIKDVLDDINNPAADFGGYDPNAPGKPSPKKRRTGSILDQALLEGGGTNAPAGKTKLSEAEKLAAKAKETIADLQKELALTKALTAEQALQVELAIGKYAQFGAGDKAAIESLSRQIEAQQAANEANEKATEAAKEKAAAQTSAIDALQRELDTINLATKAELARYETTKGAYKDYDAFSKKRIVGLAQEIDAAQAAIDAEAAALEKAKEEAKKAQDAAKELGLTFASAFEDAIVQAASLREVLQGLLQDLVRIAARKLFTEPLTSAASGLFSGGGALAGLFGGKRAQGGPVAPGRAYLVGEKGPELFVPNQSGAVMANGSGGPNITINVNNPTNVAEFARSQDQLIDRAYRAGARAAARNR